MVTSNVPVLSETFPRPEHHGIVAKRTCCASFQQPSGDTVLPGSLPILPVYVAHPIFAKETSDMMNVAPRCIPSNDRN